MISKKMIDKYIGYDLEFAISELGNNNGTRINYYMSFLNATDYLAMKLAEGLITREDKKAEFDARDFARAEINRLQK